MAGFVGYAALIVIGAIATVLLLARQRWAWGTGVALFTVALAAPVIIVGITGREVEGERRDRQRITDSLRALPQPRYTVWRVGDQIGQFTEIDPVVDSMGTRAGSVGILQRTGKDSSSTRQVLDSGVVFDVPVLPLRIGTDVSDRTFAPSPSIWSTHNAALLGRRAEPDRILTLRDSVGAVLPLHSIQIQEMVLRETTPPSAWPARFGLGDSTRRIWLVTVIFPEPAPRSR
jgi:hypothetical protein